MSDPHPLTDRELIERQQDDIDDLLAARAVSQANAQADRDDLLWLVGHLLRLSPDHTLPPRLAPLAQEAHDRYDPTRYTLDHWEPS